MDNGGKISFLTSKIQNGIVPFGIACVQPLPSPQPKQDQGEGSSSQFF